MTSDLHHGLSWLTNTRCLTVVGFKTNRCLRRLWAPVPTRSQFSSFILTAKGLTHRGFLEAHSFFGALYFFDFLNELSLQQLPPDSLTAWICIHVCRCMHSQSQMQLLSGAKHLSSHKNFAYRRSLENLYGLTPNLYMRLKTHLVILIGKECIKT